MRWRLAGGLGALTVAVAMLAGPVPASADSTTEVAFDSFTREFFPSQNNATATTLLSNNNVDYRKYPHVQVAVPSVPSGETLQAAYLRVYVTGTIPAGATLTADRVGNGWTETGLTWSNQPAVISNGPATVNAVAGWNSIPISATPGTTQSYRVRTNGPDLSMSSQEHTNGNGPEVLLDTVVNTIQNPTVTRGSTACGVVDVGYALGPNDNTSSTFVTTVDGATRDTETLVPGVNPTGGYVNTEVEDSSTGSVDVVVNVNGGPAELSFAVSTDCAANIPGLPPAGRMYYGQSTQGGDPTTFENANLGGMGVQPFRAYYQGSDTSAQIVNSISNHVSNDRLVLASFKFPMSWESVAAGGDDARMTAVAQGLNNLSRPTWVIFHHEPNGDVNSTNQTAEDFRAMYDRLNGIFEQHAPNKVAVVLCLNGQPLEGVTAPHSLVPSAEDYDLFGFDRYNPWSATNGGNWVWPEDTLPLILEHNVHDKPWVIGEYGVRHDSTNPSRATDWMQRHYDYAVANGAAMVSYFNSGANSPDGPWTLDGARLTKYVALTNDPDTYRTP